MLRRKSLYAILILLSAITVGAFYYPFNKPSSKEEKIDLTKEIDSGNMYETVTYLSKQPRAAGTDGEKRAVDYIESQFKSFGYETKVQKFPIYDFKENMMKVTVNGHPLTGEIHAFTGNVSGSVTAPLVYVGKAKQGEVDDEVNGKIALVERGEISFFEKLQNVLDHGAIGVIMYNDKPTGGFVGSAAERQYIPAVAISRDQGIELVTQLEKAPLEAALEVEVEKLRKTSYNVIATKKADKAHDTGQIVTIGAHHDSVPVGPGANDDASGVSAVLELARVFAKKSLDTELRFITFGSEEKGLIGSSYYVSTLSTEDEKRMVAHFQMDMVGAVAAGGNNPLGGLIMYTIDGDKNLVTDLGAAASKEIFSEVLPYGQLGRSDHQPFHDAGIPSALFIHSPVEPDYHQPTDTLDKISKEKLQQVAEIVGSAVYQIANPETPAIGKESAVPASVSYPFEDRSLEE